ncbi:hypothetical protein MFRU_009g00460 [Monilinia fructicola]|uniref:Uncharacterized protein n=1 Tax=Monilinia fructicola TaxID=38448 RepID=A0A5M9K691_MONFR|nr:hypothetical protein EYC84_006255 [Monilinia fructicola]KAG4031255.1 hypothetical protein MFRU_009g00460 [Monilinia fructicola]
MTSHSPLDATTRNSSSTSPIERRTTSSTYSSSNQRYSHDSSEAGESSTAASNRNSFATSTLNEDEGEQQGGLDGNIEDRTRKDGRSNHRVHNKSRSGGGFLLSNSLFHRSSEPSPTAATEHQPRSRGLLHDLKSKSSDKKQNKRQSRSNTGVGSPLASNVTSAPTTQRIEEEDAIDENVTPGSGHGQDTNASEKLAASGLDVDSAQIVNLALNLSESRRIASRRNISTPVASNAVGFRDEMAAGGNLRHHLQQQRRVSRNVSPKPDRGDRALIGSPRLSSGLKISPLPIAFDAIETTYHYHFSASTLARAEKAKKAIELMAQYRRLLQYVPPLKPGDMEKGQHTSPGGPIFSSPSSGAGSTSEQAHRVFGRHYNPLQYIRNRKVRARARISIDGEAQEFGNVHKVSWWVDEVSKAALSDNFINGNHVALPPFSKNIEEESSPHTSPQPAGSKTQTAPKLARPRIDWATDPADMLADIFWMEQGDNKMLIEDRNGRPIFPQNVEPRQSISRRPEDFDTLKSPEISHRKKANSAVELRIDTKLPDFRSSKADSDKPLESTAFKVRHKLHDAAHTQHGSGSASRERSRFLRSRSRSSSDSSDSEHMKRFSRRRRSGTNESQDDHGKDILEKQMLEMLAKESGDSNWMTPNKLDKRDFNTTTETPTLPVLNSGEKSDSSISLHQRRIDSKAINKDSPTKKKHPFISTTSGRPSLEVPGISPRNSLDGLDTTAPNSPQARASKLSTFVPSIGLDLSSPRSRRSSPNRKRALSRVRSKINPFREHSRDRSVEYEPEKSRISIDSIGSINSRIDHKEQFTDTTNDRNRSMSPAKKFITRDTDESAKSLKKKTSIRRGKGDEPSGIRGLFKGSRGPVARVSEFLWKKDWNNSAASTDESDMEDYRTPVRDTEKLVLLDKQDSRPVDVDIPHDKSIPTYINDMPTFKSPLENRGRSTQSRRAEAVIEAEPSEIGNSSRLKLEPPPRIEIDGVSPASSPEGRNRRNSDVSDISNRKGSYARDVRSTDARLNALLENPGRKVDTIFVTGLSHIKANEDRRPSLNVTRRWSQSESGLSSHRGPMTRRDIAYVKSRLYSSGIKSMYLTRQATEPVDFRAAQDKCYQGILSLTDKPLPLVSRSQQHILAANIIQDDIQLSSQLWQQSQANFSMNTIQNLLTDMGALHSRLVDNLTPMVRKAADDADEVSKDLVTSQILEVNKLTASMDKMIRRRRRRLRWVRRGGWVMVEWALVGVMWYVWFMVVLCRVVMGIGRGTLGAVKWLFWL